MKAIPGGLTKVSHCNEYVNYRGKGGSYGMKGGPKSTDLGKSTSRDATNSMGKFSNTELSPNANANSRNQ